MLRDAEAGEVFILIDALDECDSATRRTLFVAMADLFRTPVAVPASFKFLVTCRPEIHDIESHLKPVGSSLMIDSTDVNEDLSKYVDAKVDWLSHQKAYAPSLKVKVRDALKGRAGGTFLWVSLMVANLEETLNHRVEERLQNLPRGLDNTYEEILSRIPEDRREVVGFVLHCMTGAHRPLHKDEIEGAFAMWKNGEVKTRKDLDAFTDISSACGNILYVRRSKTEAKITLGFCHQSVKDYLLRSSHQAGPGWYHTTAHDANLLVFHLCWRYLTSPVFGCEDYFHSTHEASKPSSQPTRRLKRCWVGNLVKRFGDYPLISYAAREWLIHGLAIPPSSLMRLDINLERGAVLRDAWFVAAADKGEIQTMNILHSRGADVNAANQFGVSALGSAARTGDAATLVWLLEMGADVSAADDEGETPLFNAVFHGKESIAMTLLDWGAGGRRDAITPYTIPHWLFVAIRKGMVAVVKRIVESVKFSPTLEHGGTLLSLAIATDQLGMAEMLVATREEEVDFKDRDGRTPLWRAARKGHVEPVRLLLATGAVEVDSKDVQGWTPLSQAVMFGQTEVAKLLLATRAVDIDMKDLSGQTPLSMAAEFGHEEAVKLLLATGAVEVDSKNEQGYAPLCLAALGGHTEVVRLLLVAGAAVSFRAMGSKYKDVFRLLARHVSDGEV